MVTVSLEFCTDWVKFIPGCARFRRKFVTSMSFAGAWSVNLAFCADIEIGIVRFWQTRAVAIAVRPVRRTVGLVSCIILRLSSPVLD